MFVVDQLKQSRALWYTCGNDSWFSTRDCTTGARLQICFNGGRVSSIPDVTNSTLAGYRAARESAAILDQGGHARLWLAGEDRIAFSSQGESSTSEGYVYEALNGASREKLPVIFVVQNNGYGISVPVSVQSANPIVSENYRGLKNLLIVNCDGTNPFDSHRAMQELSLIHI